MSISIMARHGQADQSPLCYIPAEPLISLTQRLNRPGADDPYVRLKAN